MRQQLHDVSANEINLLNRIKSLESEKGYARAEVDKVVVKQADNFEYKQELEYKVECLSTELEHTRMMLEEAEMNKVIQRSDHDINMIEELGETIVKLKNEVSYFKKELIDSRSGKAAAEDELNTVKGTVETMSNSSNALTNEIESLNLTIKDLKEKLDESMVKANHLEALVATIEAEPDIDSKSKVEIIDLKAELAASQAEMKAKVTEILGLKDSIRLEQENVQQKDIEISRLAGQVQFVTEEVELHKLKDGDMDCLQAEMNQVNHKLGLVVSELEVTRGDNVALSGELQQQQMLYSELKKMRGRGEEVDLLQQAQRDVVVARDMAEEYHAKWRQVEGELALLSEEKVRLLRETAQLRAGRQATENGPAAAQLSGVPALTDQQQPAVTAKQKLAPSEAVMANIGSLKLYEILLWVLFISIIISWNTFTLPL